MKYTMSIKKLWDEWEIHCLVLLSFTLQFFLCFTGSLRRRSTNNLLKSIIWLAYLGADLIAVYALSFLSRKTSAESDTLSGVHQLAFFWAPFLLIHLGGQDTITSFSIQDNNLWLRHFLNLIVQVTLAIYVFWKSIDQYSYRLIASGIFVSVTGIIKYGERTMALMYGDPKNMDSFILKNKKTSGLNIDEEDGSHITEDLEHADDDYLGIVSLALESAACVRELFAGYSMQQMNDYGRVLRSRIHVRHMPKLLEVELYLIYDDLFTKAQVIRTKSGIILRSLSQISMVAAFVLFLVSDHHGYNRVDLAITYLLFSGAFFLEACAVFLIVKSPWTWSWLKSRRFCGLAHLWTSLLWSCIRQSEGTTMLSFSMGQYKFLSYVGCEKSSLSKLVKRVARMAARLVGVDQGKKPLLWLSKLVDTEHVKVDKTIMESIIESVCTLNCEMSLADAEWPKIGPILKELLPDFGANVSFGIVCFHIFTEVHLYQYGVPVHLYQYGVPVHLYQYGVPSGLVNACRNLSNYMLYLLVTRPEMLPVSGSTGTTIKSVHEKLTNFFLDKIAGEDWHRQSLSTQIIRAKDVLRALGLSSEPEACRETVEEIMSFWTRLLVYSAGKSRAAVHAAALSTGGELMTFVWLLMAHYGHGDVGERYAFSIAATRTGIRDATRRTGRKRIVLFPLPFQGHITPMLQLATQLHARGFAVTVLHTCSNAPDPTRYPADFTFVPMDDGEPFPFPEEVASVSSPGVDIAKQLHALNNFCEAPFKRALISVMRRPGLEHFACVVVDGQCYSALHAAHEIGVPALALWTDSAACMLAYPRLRDAGLIPVKEEKLNKLVPDLEPLQARDLIRVNGCDTRALCDFIGRVADAIRDSASAVIINTFERIEASELAKVEHELSVRAFAVGPLHLLELSLSQAPAEHILLTPDRDCLAWLDAQPPRSVLYVSLGSVACIDSDAFVEMAWGLAVSRVRFLWVVRQGLVSGNVEQVLPLLDGFSEEIKYRGKIVESAPQREVLAHTAIGGFWTHCGWNSVMESICQAVPMLVQPCFTDQMVNARNVTEWGVGLEVGKERGRVAIAMAVTKLMRAEDHDEAQLRKVTEVREKAQHLQKQASAATSSAIDSLVKYISSL